MKENEAKERAYLIELILVKEMPFPERGTVRKFEKLDDARHLFVLMELDVLTTKELRQRAS